MSKIKHLFSITSLVVIVVAITISTISCSKDNNNDNPSLREQIAQMIMVGFRGTGPELNEEMRLSVEKVKVGGVILFDYDALLGEPIRNITSKEQVTQLISNLKAASKTPLLVAVDQEGGNVCRLKEKYGYPPTVTMQSLGDADNPELTDFYAKRTAEMVSQSGFTMNCAPCVDLNVNPASPAIGARGRSFSASPEVVTRLASVFYERQTEYGLISSYKHFPGHGSALSDSHNGFTDVTDTWTERELEPYKNLIAANKCDVIMTSHVFNANLDPDYPATLSHKIITGILRKQMGFNGVIISDDMMMKAISENWRLEEAIYRAIDAGVDILIFSNNQGVYNSQISEQAVNIIEQLVKDGKISKERIRESYDRIQKIQKMHR